MGELSPTIKNENAIKHNTPNGLHGYLVRFWLAEQDLGLGVAGAVRAHHARDGFGLWRGRSFVADVHHFTHPLTQVFLTGRVRRAFLIRVIREIRGLTSASGPPTQGPDRKRSLVSWVHP